MNYIAIYYRADREIAQINPGHFDAQWANNGNNLTRLEISYADFPDLCDDMLVTAALRDDNGLQKYYVSPTDSIMEREGWVQAEEV